ncbi:hypothetical protein K469DRAFT_573824 [Zopfia rhizophila CBS 207.26]|uniref:Uncharacterized protein n=1 Tax=Zopfia rhizophila CBS 207.26 TaxID=1314779 RepID=A0A6A6E4U2_9PEZI|nr:hypothetical protein K469DRAFT_573824 [Zopfia rhizophila CBS 207.26]
MKASLIIAVLSTAIAMANPAAFSLNRATRDVQIEGGTLQVPCVECPCEGFTGHCTCIANGCCC